CLIWIDFDLTTGGFLDWFYSVFFKDQNQDLLAPYVFGLPIYLLEAADYFAAIFEVSGFLFLLRGRKSWIIFLTIASFFHLLNLLTLNFSFALYILCYGVFIIAPLLLLWFQKYDSLLRRNRRLLYGFILFVALTKITLVLGDIHILNYHDNDTLQAFENRVDILLWLFTIGCGIYLLRRKIYKLR
ncbi:MAG: hypothetical protein ACR2MT_11545, partial [Aurantibacter sp.]